MDKVDIFIKEYAKSLKNGKASIFIGSGLSYNSGYPLWKELLKECAEEIGLTVDKENDLISLAQFYCNSRKDRSTINNIIKDKFDECCGRLTDTQKIIGSLPFTDIWTTNYDHMIEKALVENKTKYSVVTNDSSYRDISLYSRVVVHKIHGDYSHPNECVITKKDYDKFELTHEIPLAELKGQMVSKSFLFLGYGFGDGDIQHILARIRMLYDDSHPMTHYNITRKINIQEYTNISDYEYALKKQEHYIADLGTYGINTILIDDYSEIRSILTRIKKKVFEDNIFISGAYEGENPSLSKFVEELCRELMKRNKNIITGYGKDFGQYIVNGSFLGCSSRTDGKSISECLEICAFPYSMKEGKEDHYKIIREYMARKSNVSIFIAGIKYINDKLVESDGMIKEYEEAIKNDHIIIPVAGFDGAAKHIYEEVIKENKSEKLNLLSKEITDSNRTEVINSIIEMIENMSKEV